MGWKVVVCSKTLQSIPGAPFLNSQINTNMVSIPILLIFLWDCSQARPIGNGLDGLTRGVDSRKCSRPLNRKYLSIDWLFDTSGPSQLVSGELPWPDEIDPHAWKDWVHEFDTDPSQPTTTKRNAENPEVVPLENSVEELQTFKESTLDAQLAAIGSNTIGEGPVLLQACDPKSWDTKQPQGAKDGSSWGGHSVSSEQLSWQDQMELDGWLNLIHKSKDKLLDPPVAHATHGHSAYTSQPDKRVLGIGQIDCSPHPTYHSPMLFGEKTTENPDKGLMGESTPDLQPWSHDDAHQLDPSSQENRPSTPNHGNLDLAMYSAYLGAVYPPQPIHSVGKILQKVAPIAGSTNGLAKSSVMLETTLEANYHHEGFELSAKNLHSPTNLGNVHMDLSRTDLEQAGSEADGISQSKTLEMAGRRKKLVKELQNGSELFQSPMNSDFRSLADLSDLGIHGQPIRKKAKGSVRETQGSDIGNPGDGEGVYNLYKKKPLIRLLCSPSVDPKFQYDQRYIGQNFPKIYSQEIPPKKGKGGLSANLTKKNSRIDGMPGENNSRITDRTMLEKGCVEMLQTGPNNLSALSILESTQSCESKYRLEYNVELQTLSLQRNDLVNLFHENIPKVEIFAYLSEMGISVNIKLKAQDVPDFMKELILEHESLLKRKNRRSRVTPNEKVTFTRSKSTHPILELVTRYKASLRPLFLKTSDQDIENPTRRRKVLNEIYYQNGLRCCKKLGLETELTDLLNSLKERLQSYCPIILPNHKEIKISEMVLLVQGVICRFIYRLILIEQLESLNFLETPSEAKKRLNFAFEALKEFWLSFPFGDYESQIPRTNIFFPVLDRSIVERLKYFQTLHGRTETERDITSSLLEVFFKKSKDKFEGHKNEEFMNKTFILFFNDLAVVDWLANFD